MPIGVWSWSVTIRAPIAFLFRIAIAVLASACGDGPMSDAEALPAELGPLRMADSTKRNRLGLAVYVDPERFEPLEARAFARTVASACASSNSRW